MSSNLTIRFAADMPPAAVEVVAPDYQTVTRLMLEPGHEAKVHVPSEGSFLRVHLPSGKIVTLTDERGRLDRYVSKEVLDRIQGIDRSRSRRAALPTFTKTLRELSRYHVERSDFRDFAPPEDKEAGDILSLGRGMTARVFDPGGAPMEGKLSAQGDEATWELGFGNVDVPPARLEIDHPGGNFFVVLPGNTRTVYARVDQIREGESLLVGVRIATGRPVVDSILGYLERGDLYAAEAMVDWVRQAKDLLAGKVADPYAATVGAYLLLKLRQFDLLHEWVKNLADWFEYLPDGCVLWAWQGIHQRPGTEDEIRSYLLRAADRGLPVYSFNLRLLFDGLSMLNDSEARHALDKLREAAGAVLWDSPVTAGSKLERGTFTRELPLLYDVSVMPQA